VVESPCSYFFFSHKILLKKGERGKKKDRSCITPPGAPFLSLLLTRKKKEGRKRKEGEEEKEQGRNAADNPASLAMLGTERKTEKKREGRESSLQTDKPR